MSTDLVKVSAPLWHQLQEVSYVLQAVRRGVSGSAALERVSAELRPGVQALVFHVWRNLGRAQALRDLLVARKAPPLVDALLCTALGLAWQEQDAPYEAFTLVNQTVEAAKKNPATKAQAAFINACLRRFLRERSALISVTEQQPSARWNHPPWWIARLRKEQPESWQTLLVANNAQPPLTLRVNTRQSSAAAYAQTLAHSGIAAHCVGASGVVLAQAQTVQALPGFARGSVSVQDAAAQLAAPLLLAGLSRNTPAHLPEGAVSATPLRVLDACAAPGGKTTHLLELADCELLALDVDAQRCARIHESLARLGLSAQVRVADAGDPGAWWDGQLFDAILLDAPCSASGIVRRHPDVRWLRRDTDIGQLAQVQAKLLRALWPLVKVGGRLLYCTCSVFKAEGEVQIQTFLSNNTQARLLPSPGQILPRMAANGDSVPDNLMGDHDGFYYALLEKYAP